MPANRLSVIQRKNIGSPGSERKRLGAYYTPENLSRVLTDWAICNAADRVLEPSFGKCGFLAAARRRLQELGCRNPKSQIFGCDVDIAAFSFLADVLGQPNDTGQFLQQDFLDLESGKAWPHVYASVIGNPPYIPFQAIPEKRRQEYGKKWKQLGLSVGTRASLWAYFLTHAVEFVAPNGRMAWVLPGAFLQADYAKEIRRYLSICFSDVLAVLMHQRFFKNEGTEEETVVLLAKGRRKGGPCREISFADAATLEELSTIIDDWDSQPNWVGKVLDARPSYLAAEKSVISAFESLRATASCHPLGDFVRAAIGLVTGANKFFVLSNNDKLKLELREEDTVRILGKFKAVQGLKFTIGDHDQFLESGARGHLVNTTEQPPEGSALRLYLDTFPENERESVRTFEKRRLWFAPDDGNTPDAFLPVMNHGGPRLALNEARINCTNTLHRAFFRAEITDAQKKLIAISMMTSFSQLSAEFVGRRYGSGVLKHEPREIEKIAVIIPDISDEDVETAFNDIDCYLRDGNSERAMEHADKIIFRALENAQNLSTIFIKALGDIRTQRRTARQHLGT